MSTRQSWLDDSTQTPMIDSYVHKLETFISAMADGKIDLAEVQGQEKRLTTLMKEIEPALNDSQHGQITKLLCELTAYNIMQTLYSLQNLRPPTKFKG